MVAMVAKTQPHWIFWPNASAIIAPGHRALQADDADTQWLADRGCAPSPAFFIDSGE
ncbi:hypothetical protein AAHN93_01935 [Vandammella animalimorsus]|uniref:hypothetical protein n=1 Tax=Vandammella animalimorsus TaxID=2029117 RepID=UPI001555FA6B|nr:hypothetical protein [Vandammella animalimorsus]